MIAAPTLFIVGAGASKELQFPLGSELLGILADLFNVERDTFGRWVGPQRFRDLTLTYGKVAQIDPNIIFEKAAFIRSKLLGTVKSIDQLVHTYSTDHMFTVVAKLGIACIIAAKEEANLSKLKENLPINKQAWNKGNWLHTFCTHYFAGFDRSETNRLFEDVSFVCFNYDRCLEYALLRMVAHHFELTDEQSMEVLGRIKIEHPYGSLGELPAARSALNHVFETDQRDENVIAMAANIKTFTEGTHEDGAVERIENLIVNATNVVCLGFGFNAMNVGLFHNPLQEGKAVYGTTYKLSESNASSAQYQMCRQLKSAEVRNRFKAETSSDFLDQFELTLFR